MEHVHRARQPFPALVSLFSLLIAIQNAGLPLALFFKCCGETYAPPPPPPSHSSASTKKECELLSQCLNSNGQKGSIEYLLGCVIIAGISLQPTLAKKSTTMKTILRIEELQNCQDRPNTTEYRKHHNYFSKVNIQRVKMDQVINAEYVLNRPVDSIQASLTILRCDGVHESTCEHLMRMKISLCDVLVEKGQAWSPLIQAMQPPCRCPLNKPLYKFVNGSLSTGGAMPFLNSIPMGSEYYWRAKFTYSDPKTNTEAGCLYLVFKFYKVRSR